MSKEAEDAIKKFENEIDQRIAHLKSVDAEFCKDRWDMTKPEMERNIYREMSNQVTATRQELEMLKKTLSIPDEFVITIIPADPDENDGKFCWEIHKGTECVSEARTEFNSKEEAEADAKKELELLNPYQDVRAIAHKTYQTDMAAFTEGCGQSFTALAWHIYKRAFDIASYSLKTPIREEEVREKLRKLLSEKQANYIGTCDELINCIVLLVKSAIIKPKEIKVTPEENPDLKPWIIPSAICDAIDDNQEQKVDRHVGMFLAIGKVLKLHKNSEFVICSAVKWQNTIICGRKHKNCYEIADALMNGGFLERERKHQGFMTSTGRYVDRAEAFKIAKANNQIVHKLFDDVTEGNLNSEDLFGEE